MSGNGVAGLPARPGSLTDSPGARLRRVRSLAGILPGLGVTVSSAEDGHVSVRLPAEVAELFLLDLEERAREWQAAMRKARLQEQERHAELWAHSEETRRRVEAQEEAWLAEYERLRAEGKGDREALWLIRGPDDQDAPTICMLEYGIKQARARQKTQAVETRDAEIARLAQEGLTRQEIADRLRMPYITVHAILRRHGIPVQVKRTYRSKVPAEWCKQGR